MFFTTNTPAKFEVYLKPFQSGGPKIWNLGYVTRATPLLADFSFLPHCIECRRGIVMRILSVRQSVTRMNCNKTLKRSVLIFIPYKRTVCLVFWEEWLVGATPSTWNFGSTGPLWSKIADFARIIARSASAVTPSENVHLTLIGSPLSAFQWA